MSERIHRSRQQGFGGKDLEDKQKIIDSKRSEIITLTEAERAAWVEAMKPVWKQFEDAVGKENLAAAIAANK
jgi:Bacterial extracellular solute-binding protein, family 7.